MIPKLVVGFLFIFLLGFAHGASLATAQAKESNCTLSDGLQALTCAIRVASLGGIISDLDLSDKMQVMDFKESCDQAQNCFEEIVCSNPDLKANKEMNKLKSYCNALVYVATDFADCSHRLEERNTTCYQEWEPFPDGIEKELDPKKREKMQIEGCTKYFGKEQCIKKEIIETCGQQDWYGFYDSFGAISSILYECDVTHMS